MGCIALKALVPKAEQTEVRLARLKVATPHIKWLVKKNPKPDPRLPTSWALKRGRQAGSRNLRWTSLSQNQVIVESSASCVSDFSRER